MTSWTTNVAPVWQSLFLTEVRNDRNVWCWWTQSCTIRTCLPAAQAKSLAPQTQISCNLSAQNFTGDFILTCQVWTLGILEIFCFISFPPTLATAGHRILHAEIQGCMQGKIFTVHVKHWCILCLHVVKCVFILFIIQGLHIQHSKRLYKLGYFQLSHYPLKLFCCWGCCCACCYLCYCCYCYCWYLLLLLLLSLSSIIDPRNLTLYNWSWSKSG